MNRSLKPLLARLLTLALVASSWPAWAASAPILAPAGAVAGPRAFAPANVSLAAPGMSFAGGLGAGPSILPTLAAPNGVTPRTAVGDSSPAHAAAARAVVAAAPAVVNAVSAPQLPAVARAAAAAPGTEVAGRSAAGTPYIEEGAVRGKTVIMVGTKNSRPFILEEAVRVAKALGISLVLVDDPSLRAKSAGVIPDSHFIAAPLNRRDPASIKAIADAVSAHPEAAKAHAVVSFLSLYAKATGAITDRLGAAGIPGAAVTSAEDKTLTRGVLNAVPELAVPFREVKSADEARRAFRELGGGRFVLKTIRGENSRFLHLGLDSEAAAAKAWTEADAAIRAYMERPEAKSTTFAEYPGIMLERMLEKAPGSEETSVEVVMQHGRPAFAMVSDTKTVGKKLELAGGSMSFPSQQAQAAQAAFIAAAAKALEVLGIHDGSARVDMMLTPEGPRVVEVNPYMGGVAIWKAVHSLTGMSLVEQGLRAVLGLKVDPGTAPAEVVDYRFPASILTGTLEAVEGVEAAAASAGVDLVRMFVEPGDTVMEPAGNSYEEVGEIIGKGPTLEAAMAANRAALAKIVMKVRLADGSVVSQTGENLQPIAPDTPEPERPVSKSVGLFSKVVIGFLSTFILVSTVVESTSLAVSQMTAPLSQGFMALAALTSISYGAYTAGSFLGGRWVDRFGIDMSYRAVLAFRTVVWTGMAAFFFAFGTVPLWALVPLFSIDYFAHSIGRVAEHKLQVSWFHDSPTESSRFGSFRDFVEYGTVFIGSAMGLAVAALGFGAVIYPAPLAFAAAALISLALKLPGASREATKKIDWGAGFRSVFGNGGILKPLAGYMLINSFLYMLYYIVATAFGAYVAGDPAQAAAVSGSLTGLYGVGALLGALAMDRLAVHQEKATAHLAEPARGAAQRALYNASAVKSLKWAALAILGSWALVSQVKLFTFAWPFFLISPALVAIGFTAQRALIHLDTIMKDRIPQEDKSLAGSILGAIRSLTYMSHVLGFLLWGGLFAAFGTGAFVWFAGFYTLAAGAYLLLARSMSRA